METFIPVILGGITSIFSGLILFVLKRYVRKNDEQKKSDNIYKQKENSLILRSLKALGKLTVANSIALRDGKTNGEMSGALDEYEEVEKEMYIHLINGD